MGTSRSHREGRSTIGNLACRRPDFHRFMEHEFLNFSFSGTQWVRCCRSERRKSTKYGHAQRRVIAYANSKIPLLVEGCFKGAFSFINAGANLYRLALSLLQPSLALQQPLTHNCLTLRENCSLPFFRRVRVAFCPFQFQLHRLWNAPPFLLSSFRHPNFAHRQMHSRFIDASTFTRLPRTYHYRRAIASRK